MINLEDFSEFEKWFCHHVIKNPSARYGENFLKYFNMLDNNLSYNEIRDHNIHEKLSTWEIWTELDKEKARDMCLKFILDNDDTKKT